MSSGQGVLEAVAEMPSLHKEYLTTAGLWVGQHVCLKG